MSKHMLTTNPLVTATVFLSACLFSVFVIAVCCIADVHPKSFEVIEPPEMHPRFTQYLELSTAHPIPVVSVTFEYITYKYGTYPKKWKLDVVRRVGVHIPKVSDNQVALLLPDLRTPPLIQYRTLKAHDMSVFPVFEFSSRYLARIIDCRIFLRCHVTAHLRSPALPIIGPIADPTLQHIFESY